MDQNQHYGSFSSTHEDSSLSYKGRFWRLWKKVFPRNYKEECVEQIKMALPTILTSFSRFFSVSVSIMMCGHLDKYQLDAAALANSLVNVFGLAVNLGFSTACDTLFSQSFGSKNKKMTGLYLQQAFVVIIPILLVMAAIYLNIEPFLLLIGQDPLISYMAADYLYYFIPGLFFDGFFIIFARFMQNQGMVYPPMLAGMTNIVVNVVSQYVSIYVYDQNYQASAICQAASFGAGLLFEVFYIFVFKIYKPTWDGWKWKGMWCSLGSFYIIGIAGILMVALEEWGFEFGVFISGTLGTTQLGAQSIILQIESLAFMIPLGMSVVVNIRLGNCLGAGDPIGAIHVFRVAVTLILITASLMCIVFLLLSRELVSIYTGETDVIDMAAKVIPFLTLFQFCDGIAGVSSGALRGCGRQVTAAVMVFIGFYFISLPIGFVLATQTYLEVQGVWIGLVLGMFIEGVAFFTLVQCINWELESKKAKLRVGEEASTDDVPESLSSEESEEDHFLLKPPKTHQSQRRTLSMASGTTRRLIAWRVPGGRAHSMDIRSADNSFPLAKFTRTNQSSKYEEESDNDAELLGSTSRRLRESEKSLPWLVFKRTLLYFIPLCIFVVAFWYREYATQTFSFMCQKYNATEVPLCN